MQEWATLQRVVRLSVNKQIWRNLSFRTKENWSPTIDSVLTETVKEYLQMVTEMCILHVRGMSLLE